MSGDRKRAEPYELVRDVRKKPRLESPDQEITVHPYDDDFFGSDNESMERVVSGFSPDVTLEPGVDISIDSPALFPLSKTSRETSKHSRRRRYRGVGDSDSDPPQLTKSTTLPVRSSRQRKEQYSKSRSKSPFSIEHNLKVHVAKRNTSSGRISPILLDFDQDSRHSSDQHSRSSDRPTRSKHTREHKSKHLDPREHDPRSSSREGREETRIVRDHHGRQRSVDMGTFDRRKDRSRYPREQDRTSYKHRSPSRREGKDHPHSEQVSRRREDRAEKSRDGGKRHRGYRSRLLEREEATGKLPEVVVERGSGDESRSGGVGDRIEDLIKEIEESSTDSSSDDQEGEVVESQGSEFKSPESVSSKSFSSEEGGSVGEGPPAETEEHSQDTQDTQSHSEGEVRSPEPANPYVMRSRFDSSDQSEEEEEINQVPSQQGHPLYNDELEEEIGASPVNSPPPPPPEEAAPADATPPYQSPSPPPVPSLPPYLPALMGCKNVESYQWLDRIEEGTYGVVYKAKDKRTGDIVALKKLKMEKEKEGFPITSLREINMLLKAAHPNIVPVREIVVGSNMDKIYIVMDFIKHDLKALMSTMKEKFLEGEVKTLMLHLLRAVHHMHDNWILHRDLKTSNLLLSHDNILKVADFGLAREYGSPLLNYTPVVVTLWYRSPELLLGVKEYSTAVDVWSVGCIFAELLLHKALFVGRSEIDQLNKIFTELGTPNEKIWPGFKQLPGAKNVTFAHHPQGNLRKKNSSLTTKSGFDLLFKLLTYDPSKRITARDALDHQYFKDMPRPVPPEMFPTWPTKSEIAKNKTKREKSPTPPEGGAAFVLKGADQISPIRPGPGFSLKF